MFNKQKFAFNVAFPYKYAAINNITGVIVKNFRTAWGAKRWADKPIVVFDDGQVFTYADLGTQIYEIEDPIGYLVYLEQEKEDVDAPLTPTLDAFQLMQDYAEADVELTTKPFESTVQPYIPTVDGVTPGWCELCQVNHYDDGVFTRAPQVEEQWVQDMAAAEPTPDDQPMLPEMSPEHWSDAEGNCAGCDWDRAKEQEESDKAQQLLREKLGATVIEETHDSIDAVQNSDLAGLAAREAAPELEPEVVLISVEDWINMWSSGDMWGSDDVSTGDLAMSDEFSYVVHNLASGEYENMFYQLTPEAVEALGTFR
jgi:hypothetical protein